MRDEHYGGPRPAPRRTVRPKTAAEKEFCALGPVAEAFITGAAAAGHTRLGPEVAALNTLRAAHGDEQFLAALDHAVAFCRWRAADVRSILAAGNGTADPRPAGDALILDLPAVPVRPLAGHASAGCYDRGRAAGGGAGGGIDRADLLLDVPGDLDLAVRVAEREHLSSRARCRSVRCSTPVSRVRRTR